MSAAHRRRFFRRPATLAGWIVMFVGGFVLAAAGAALAYFLLTVAYDPGNYALAQASKLSSPTAASVTEISSTSVRVAWTDPAQQLTGAQYEVVRTGSTQGCLAGASASSCTVMGLTPGTHYSFTVTAVIGSNWQSTSTTASFTTLGVTTTSLTPAAVGAPYSASLHATGGSGSYMWSQTSGTVPPGLSLTPSTGTISGTPTTAGTFSGLVYRVTDSNGVTATSVSLTIVVTKGKTSFSITVTGSSSSATIAYGSQATFSESGLTTSAAGTIAITATSPSTTLCTITDFPATTTCKTSTTQAAGSYSGIEGTFTPSTSNYTGSTSNSVYLTISPVTETSVTALSPVSTPKTVGAEGQTLSGTVSGSFGTPKGTVTVRATGTAISTCTSLPLTAGSGTTATYSCVLGTSALTVGTHSIVATYVPGSPSSTTGSHSYSTSSSTAQTLTVDAASVCTGTRSFSLAAGATVNFTAVGGGGGAGSLAGGPGASISGTLHNTTASNSKTITYKVGCTGTSGQFGSSDSPGGAGGGGYAAGGAGGHGHASTGTGHGGGGGGGATDMQIGSTYIVVAGGGGGGSTTSPADVTTKETAPTPPAAGLAGGTLTNSNKDGGGGGGGGAKVRATGGAKEKPGNGGFSYVHGSGTVGGVTVTTTATISSGGNAGAAGSVTFYTAPKVTGVYPAYAPDGKTLHMTIIGDTFAPGATVSLWSACSTKDKTAASVTWVNSTTLRATVTVSTTSSQHCVQVTEGPGAVLSSVHTLSGGNFFTQKPGGPFTGMTGTLTILPGNTSALSLSVTSGTANLCSTLLANRALYFSEPTISVGSLTCSGTGSPYTLSGTVTVGSGAITSPPKVSVTLTGGSSHTDAVVDETAITVDPPSTPPGTPLTAPTVTALAPASGTAAGSTWVTISGTSFRWTAVVDFGATASPSVVVTSTTSITALTPAHAAGPAAVSISTVNGTSVTTSADLFNYETASTPPEVLAPSVASISPATGPGSTVVTITGTNLTAVTAVDFGSVPGTTLVLASTGTTLTVDAPTGTVGTTVTVSLVVGSSPPVPVGHFTYTSAPASTSSTPPKTPPAAATTPPGTATA